MEDITKFTAELPSEPKSKNAYSLAFRYSLVNIIGSFLSIVIAAILIYSSSVELPKLKDLLKNGEAIIICISLIISCIYTLHDIETRSNWYHFTYWGSFLIVIISIVFYVITADRQFFSYSMLTPERMDNWISVIRTFSIIVFLWTLYSVFYSQVQIFYDDNPELRYKRNDEFKELRDAFEKIKTDQNA